MFIQKLLKPLKKLGWLFKIKLRYKIILSLLVSVIFVFGVGFVYVVRSTYQPELQYLNEIQNNRDVVIEKNDSHYVLNPVIRNSNVPEIIYYSGGLVQSEGYLYRLGNLAIRLQTRIFLIRPPLNLAILNIDQAQLIVNQYGLKNFWVGGHSLGGVVACRYAKEHQELVYGMFLFGAYCDQDIKDFKGRVEVLYGEEDKVLNVDSLNKANSNLPVNAITKSVPGLNHSNFGNYGSQKSDGNSELNSDQILDVLSAVFN